MRTQTYPSDVTDEQWALLEPDLPVSTGGRPRKTDLRDVLDAICQAKKNLAKLNKRTCPLQGQNYGARGKSGAWPFRAVGTRTNLQKKGRTLRAVYERQMQHARKSSGRCCGPGRAASLGAVAPGSAVKG